jgi:hypothetical protein
MTTRPPISRPIAIAGAIAAALVLGTGGYFAGQKPAESQVLPAGAPASTSAAGKASVTASSAAKTAQRPASAPPPVAVATRTREQAAAALMALPELQAWSALLEKNSGGKAHGALIEYDPAPRKLNGKSYWQFSFVENNDTAALRWESFLASSSDDEILVEDANTDEVISLARWRREKHPAKRTGADG